MPLFGKSQKNPADLVKSLKDSLETLDKAQDKKKTEKVSGSKYSIICADL